MILLNVSAAAAILIYNLKKINKKEDMMKKLLEKCYLCVSLNADINQAVLGILGSSDYNTTKI